MTDLYEINTRNRKREKEDEPTDMDNDLEERLYSIKNDIDLALLAFYTNSHYLISTAIEDAFYKLQKLVDDYCVIGED